MYHKDLKGCNLHIARSAVGATSPAGVRIPSIEGEFYFQYTTGALWTAAVRSDVNSWSQVGKDPIIDTSGFTLVLSAQDSNVQSIANTIDQVIADGSTTALNKTWSANKLSSTFANLPKFWVLQGDINAPSDFPTLANVQNGWIYAIKTTVTDNDPTKTNTGQTFVSGNEIAWNGTNWTEIGSVAIWSDNGTTVATVNTRDIDLGNKGLRSSYTSTGILLSDASNPQFNTTNKTITGSVNELKARIDKTDKIESTIIQSSTGFTVLTPVYFNIDTNLWAKAKADSFDTLATHVVSSIINATTFKICQVGLIEIPGHGKAEGYWFTSDTTAGETVEASPVISNPVFFVQDANTIHVFGSASAGAVQSHGALIGLTSDDHPQYYNEVRGDLRYAPLAKGVSGGDTHAHVGGQGAQIDYSTLSSLPTLGTASALNFASTGDASLTEVVKGDDSRLTNSRTPISHGNESHNVTFITASSAVAPNAPIAGATKTKITYDSKGLVTSGADATTADIADSTNKRYVTDAQLTVIGNTSNTNTGDVTLATNSGLSLTNQVVGMGTPSTITTGTTNNVTGATHTHALTLPTIPTDISGKKYIIQTADASLPNAQAMGALATGIVKNTTTTGVQTIAVAGTDFVAPNTAITGATATKITYDSKGLVTGSSSATASDVGLGNVTNNAQLTIANNLSDVNNRQTALNNITAVSAATNEYILTKDTSTGNALWKVNGASLPVGTVNQTLRHNGTTWESSSALTNDGSYVYGNFFETYTSVSTSSTSHTIDWNNGGVQKLTLAHSPVTLTFTAPTGGSKNLRLILTQDATGNRTIIFPTSIIFEDNIPPLFNRAPNANTIIDLFYDGTNYIFTRPILWGRPKVRNFYSVATDPNSGVNATAISSGTVASVAGVVGNPSTKIHNGIVRITKSTIANSGYRFMTNEATHLISGGDIFVCDFYMNTVAATTTTRIGFHDDTTVTDAVDGVYFEIISNGTVNVLTGKTSNNSTRSTTSTSYNLTTNSWYKVVIIVRYDAARVDYYLYDDPGTLLWTNNLTTNIPTGAGRNCGVGVVTTQTGTTATAIMDINYFRWGNQSNY